MKDLQLTASCNPGRGRGPTPAGVVCGDYAVNTIQPTYQPFRPGTASTVRLPPQTGATIGDRLSAAESTGPGTPAAGRTRTATSARRDGPTGPARLVLRPGDHPARVPELPGQVVPVPPPAVQLLCDIWPGTRARTAHLRDEQEFLEPARSSRRTCNLKAVSFVKPVGAENEHPGYASESAAAAISWSCSRPSTRATAGRTRWSRGVRRVRRDLGSRFPSGLGGPASGHDEWGPGTRVPALIISPFLRGEFVVDHTAVRHDVDPGDDRAALQSSTGLDARCTRARSGLGLRREESLRRFGYFNEKTQ